MAQIFFKIRIYLFCGINSLVVAFIVYVLNSIGSCAIEKDLSHVRKELYVQVGLLRFRR